MSVTFKHPDYEEKEPRWKKIKHVLKGEDKIKDETTTYLPKPDPDDASKENDTRYSRYVERSVFYNFTKRTLWALIGTAFRKPATLTVPTGLEYVEDDIDGNGISIYQQSIDASWAALSTGRGGLLADYPQTEAGASLQDLDQGNIRANCVFYPETAITNWRVTKVGNKHLLSLVVLAEDREVIDGFRIDKETIYRVLRLTDMEDGESLGRLRYVQEVWAKAGDSVEGTDIKAGDYVMESQVIPRKGNGQEWDMIPFTFVGSVNNDPTVDDEPLYDLASMNIAHYRNSAEYEDTLFWAGQIQPVITGLNEDWRDYLEERGIKLGSLSLLPLPEGSDYKLVQASPNPLASEGMKQKQEIMAQLGARLIERGGAVRTATEAQDQREAETSQLSLAMGNVSDAYTTVLGWMAEFNNLGQPEVEYAIQQEYLSADINPQLLTALLSAVQGGAMALPDFWEQMRRYGLTEATDEEIQESIDNQMPDLDIPDPTEDNEPEPEQA